jgi:hypothetical protein
VTKTTWLILLLSFAGAARVWFFAGAYPMFNHSDETLHFDVIAKYARIGIPTLGKDKFDRVAARYLVAYSRVEPPSYETLLTFRDAETFTPPLYYATAALWYDAGEVLRLRGLGLLYWMRAFNGVLYGLAIYVACQICLLAHRPALVLPVGLLMAVLPQDILYTINSDAFSPIAAACALYLIFAWAKKPTAYHAAMAGLAVALAMLAKYSNIGLYAAAGAAILLYRHRTAWIVIVASALPVAAWMLRCHLAFGDWTAPTLDKAQQLGWTTLTLKQSLHHPIFGVGVIDFLHQLTLTYWRGELIWQNTVQRSDAVDALYVCITLIALLGVLGWLLRPTPAARTERPAALVHLAMVVGTVVFLGLISTRFEYGRSFYPSRGHPYFSGARLLTGCIIPLSILTVGGIFELFNAKRLPATLAVAAICCLCLGSELYLCLRDGVFQTDNVVDVVRDRKLTVPPRIYPPGERWQFPGKEPGSAKGTGPSARGDVTAGSSTALALRYARRRGSPGLRSAGAALRASRDIPGTALRWRCATPRGVAQGATATGAESRGSVRHVAPSTKSRHSTRAARRNPSTHHTAALRPCRFRTYFVALI